MHERGAAAGASPALAAQMYAVGVMGVGKQNVMEHACIDELARWLKLDAGLKATLEQRARRAAGCAVGRPVRAARGTPRPLRQATIVVGRHP